MSQEAISKKRLTAFRMWLSANGAQVLEPTSEWEVVRFKSGAVTSVIYTNKACKLTFTGDSLSAFDAFRGNHAWRAVAPTKRQPRKPNSPVVATLLSRDGRECFFCLDPVARGFESVEHLVAVTHGGPNHISNFVLAHPDCNSRAGHLSASEKIAIRVKAILARANLESVK